jgi:hypothetical protein
MLLAMFKLPSQLFSWVIIKGCAISWLEQKIFN